VVSNKLGHHLRDAALHLEVERIPTLRAVDGNHRHSVRIAATENGLVFRSYFRHDGSQSDAFDDGGNTLADTDAHGAKCPFCFASFQLPSSGQHQPRTAHPKRMPEGDSASVRIDMFPILQQAEVAQHRDALGGESFVKFDDVDLMIMAAAPSLIPEELPAVTVPPGRNTGLSLASCSSVVSGRGCSSSATSIVFFPVFTVSGTISSAKRPSAFARAARCWLRSAIAS